MHAGVRMYVCMYVCMYVDRCQLAELSPLGLLSTAVRTMVRVYM
jgi:hypothetical protein